MTMSYPQPPVPPVPSAWRRLGLIALAVALVMLVGGGAGGYLLARDVKKSADRATCGNLRCIPSLQASSVIDALTGRGFTCAEKSGTWECQLRIGDTRYRSRLLQQDGLIYNYDDSVQTEKDGEASASTRAFLLWFAALPFADDPVLTEEIEGWLTQRLSGGANTKATIGGYIYDLTALDQQYLRLNVWAGSR